MDELRELIGLGGDENDSLYEVRVLDLYPPIGVNTRAVPRARAIEPAGGIGQVFRTTGPKYESAAGRRASYIRDSNGGLDGI